ncbi:MAG: CoA transferase subunit A [Myxococcota bacterium]
MKAAFPPSPVAGEGLGVRSKKIRPSAASAIADINNGCIIMAGGFGLCGNPENLIKALADSGIKDIHLISNNCGTTDKGLGVLLQNKQVSRITASYVGENSEFERQLIAGEIEVDLVPQGTLAERIRIGGAGIPAFYTPTGVGTEVAKNKETRIFDGREYLLETALKADFALIKAYKADPFGNLIFRKTARNFNPMMCAAAKTTIVEVEELVDLGQLDPDCVHVPGIYINRIIVGTHYDKWIEHRTIRHR